MDARRVFIVSNDPLARAGLAALVESLGFTLAGQEGLDTLTSDALAAAGPDVVVVDAGTEPHGAAESLAVADAGYPVVALLPAGTETNGALASGLRGLLSREVEGDALAAALHGAAGGLVVLDPAFVPTARTARDREPPRPAEELTPRELDVLQLLAEGLSNKEIARRLDLSEHTVKFHVDSILGKLGAHSRTEAVTRAARLGLIIL
jgi:DNA-binding NarL/FixJ family response regulator